MEAFVNFLALVFVRGCLFAILSVELTDAALETASRIVATFYRNIVLRLFSKVRFSTVEQCLLIADMKLQLLMCGLHLDLLCSSTFLRYECHTLRP